MPPAWHKRNNEGSKPAGAKDEKVPKTERNKPKTRDRAKIPADQPEKYDLSNNDNLKRMYQDILKGVLNSQQRIRAVEGILQNLMV